MAIERRSALRLLAGALVGSLSPGPLRAEAARDARLYLSARATAAGGHWLTGLTASGRCAFDLPLPGRGHSFAVQPGGHTAVHFARRPGRFALVIDLVEGTVSRRIEAPIARNPRDRVKMAVREEGRRAVTHFRTCEKFALLSLIRVELETGRTHQIRVHLQHTGHPVFGDPSYGGRSRLRGIAPEHRSAARQALELIGRQALHASRLSFEHPSTGKTATFSSPLPGDMERVLERLRRPA